MGFIIRRPFIFLIMLVWMIAPVHADFPQNQFTQSMKELGVDLDLEDGRFGFFDRSVAENKDSKDSIVVEIDSPVKTESVILKHNSVRADDFKVYYYNSNNEKVEFIPEAPKTYRGKINNQDYSTISASITEDGLFAIVDDPDHGRWITQPVSNHATGSEKISLQVNYFEKDIIETPGICAVDTKHRNLFANQSTDPINSAFENELNTNEKYSYSAGEDLSKRNDELCYRVVDIAIDCDFEFFAANSVAQNTMQQNVQRTIDDVEMVMNNVSATYEDTFGIRYNITEIIVRTNLQDPYTSFDANNLLIEHQNEWLTNQINISRDVVHLFTGKDIIGDTIGLAYLGTICDIPFQYGLSQSNFTPIIPLRAALTEHELGHNWNANHCDGDPDCFNMCSGIGGCTGIINNFGDATYAAIIPHKNSRECLTAEAGIIGQINPIAVQDNIPVPDVPVILDLLENDFDLNCDQLIIDSFDELSNENAVLTLFEDGQNFQGIVYDPENRNSDSDEFNYTILDTNQTSDQGTVFIEVFDENVFELASINLTNTVGEPVVFSWQTSSELISNFAFRLREGIEYAPGKFALGEPLESVLPTGSGSDYEITDPKLFTLEDINKRAYFLEAFVFDGSPEFQGPFVVPTPDLPGDTLWILE